MLTHLFVVRLLMKSRTSSTWWPRSNASSLVELSSWTTSASQWWNSMKTQRRQSKNLIPKKWNPTASHARQSKLWKTKWRRENWRIRSCRIWTNWKAGGTTPGLSSGSSWPVTRIISGGTKSSSEYQTARFQIARLRKRCKPTKQHPPNVSILRYLYVICIWCHMYRPFLAFCLHTPQLEISANFINFVVHEIYQS